MSEHTARLADLPAGWGFCGNRDCECWWNDATACGEYESDPDDPHPFGRCERCGWDERRHGVTRATCDLCGELVTPADPDGRANVRPMVAHRACAVRSALGGIGHVTDHALWCGERNDPDGGMSYRASALAVLAWVERNGGSPP